jgi:hypothetical protein
MGDFIMVHNGVLDFNVDGEYIYEDMQGFTKVNADIETDSYKFMCIFYYYFNKLKTLEDRTQAITKALQNALTHTGGNFSIFLVDRKDDFVYYFKDTEKMFYFKAYVNTNTDWELYGSTTSYNLDYLKYYGDEKGVFTKTNDGLIYEFVPSSRTIYKIDTNENNIENVVTELAEFEYYKKPEKVYRSYHTGYNSAYHRASGGDLSEETLLDWCPNVMKAMDVLGVDFEDFEWDEDAIGEFTISHKHEEYSDAAERAMAYLNQDRCRVHVPYTGLLTIFLYDYDEMVAWNEQVTDDYHSYDEDDKLANYKQAKKDANVTGLELLF